MRALNENPLTDQFAHQLAKLTGQVAQLSRRLDSVESTYGNRSSAQQPDLTIICHDNDQNSIHLLTENGFLIVRPWEAKPAQAQTAGTFRFQVQAPDGAEKEISVEISTRLLNETAARTRGRIEPASQFWVCSAERRLANYLMEHDEFPPAKELIIETLDREDVLLAIRWEQTE